MDYHTVFILLGVIGVIILLYVSKIDDEYIIYKKENNEDAKDTVPKKQRTFLGIDIQQWGWISVITNGLSVAFQMFNLFKTRSAQSFSMYFIFLMTLLNAVYCLIGLFTLNWGLAIATFMFVVYNLTVVYFYYFGKQK
jgi:hypothetical protein